jgi:hypothetical protein
MQRNGSNGIWYWVEGGTINMSLDPSGNLGARAGISGTTLQVTNVLGINYSGIGGYWIAFGWNGSLNLYVNGGYQYDVASTQWINGNFYPAGTTDGRYLYKSGDTCTGTLLAHGGVYTIDGSHGMFVSGADRYVQFQSNWYFHYVNSTGNLLWYNPFGVSMVFSYGDSRIYNNQGPMGGVGAYQNLSDERLKRDITPAAYGLAEILRLEPIRFTRLPRSTKDRAERHPEIGLSAQQVQAVLPEAVTAVDLADDEGGKETSLAIGYDALTAALINAVKELSARVVALEAR